jgi:acetylglutamate kinase
VLDKNKKLIDEVKTTNLGALISDGTITGGMIPKLETAAQSVLKGVNQVSIMDGRVKHSIIRALSGEQFGTKIVL